MSSLRLFKVAMCGLDIIKNFSEMHKLHRLVRVVYALAFARIFHVIVKSFGFLSREHIADVNLNDTSVYMEIN